MKKLLLVFMCLLLFTGCKEEKEDNKKGTTTTTTTVQIANDDKSTTTTTEKKSSTKKTTTKTTKKKTTTSKKTTTTKKCEVKVNDKCYKINDTITYTLTLTSSDKVSHIGRLYIDMMKKDLGSDEDFYVVDIVKLDTDMMDSLKASPDYEAKDGEYKGFSYGIELGYEEVQYQGNPNFTEDFSKGGRLLTLKVKATKPGTYKFRVRATGVVNPNDNPIKATITGKLS